jgi:hypothetical protein
MPDDQANLSCHPFAPLGAWAEHTGGVTHKVRKVSESPYSALIDKIENLAMRSMMNGILAENSQPKSKPWYMRFAPVFFEDEGWTTDAEGRVHDHRAASKLESFLISFSCFAPAESA